MIVKKRASYEVISSHQGTHIVRWRRRFFSCFSVAEFRIFKTFWSKLAWKLVLELL